MSAVAECVRCGAQLSRYRSPSDPAGLCAPCAGVALRPAGVVALDHESLTLAVGGVLALASAKDPGEPVYVQERLRMEGIEASTEEVYKAVEKLRRRYGWIVVARARQAGYTLRRWPWRFRRRRRAPQLRLF